MSRFILYLGFSLGALLSVETAVAVEPICHDFSSNIEPDMQRTETDFTAENYRLARRSLDVMIPEWMEGKFKQSKKSPETYEKLFQGEIWLAHANSTAMVKGYVLKLEYLTAVRAQKEDARTAFCKFVTLTPYYD